MFFNIRAQTIKFTGNTMTNPTEDDKKFKRPESVLVLIYSLSGDVLMLHRTFPEDFWQSVTGSLEWGEEADAAAVRELREETGLDGFDVINCQHSQEFEIYSIWRDRYPPGTTHNKEHVFLLELDECRPVHLNPREHTEFRWVSREEAIQLATSHTNAEAILKWVPELPL